jgi:hypothetical protein
MKKKLTKIEKFVRMFSGTKEVEEQFANDVQTWGDEFTAVADKLDIRNPWDQALLVAILTNMLACVTVNAMLDSVNLEEAIRDNYYQALTEYKKQAAQELLKGNI